MIVIMMMVIKMMMMLSYDNYEDDTDDDYDNHGGTDEVYWKNASPTGAHFHDGRIINVASKVLTRFYYSHITKNNPPPGVPVFKPTQTIFKLVQYIIRMSLLTKFHEDRKKKMHCPWWPYIIVSNLLTKKNAPPLGGHDFQPTGTIFELIQYIIRTENKSGSRVFTRFY
ncbi:hypothetical protein DPMN_050980 [Dreissena polymorpha]|uniref:Uncharacterized protein n=1 Tax=Dreissena polymorpha TaxID=45954 RepID=A0A9D4CHR9_DREPO|nr:hypothetical protein DPMN_050980 [Dreissena polymorpha]